MKGLTLIVLVLLCGNVTAQQNLVPNGSFEEYSVCPTGPNPWTVNNWLRATITPDYFNACISGINEGSFVDTPCNNRGCQEPRTGDAYVGFFALDRNYPDVREFIQVELLEPLVSSVRYLVEFYVSPAEDYGYAISTLGAALTAYHPPVITIGDYEGMLDAVPQVLNGIGPITDTIAWTLIRDTVVSREGGERFVSIGNFHSDSYSDTLHFNPTAVDERAAYYYIDDVSVIALDSVPSSIGDKETFEFSVYPNPAVETLNIKSAKELAGVRVLDMRGRTVYSENITAKTFAVDIKSVQAGMYVLEVTDKEGRRATERFIKTAVP